MRTMPVANLPVVAAQVSVDLRAVADPVIRSLATARDSKVGRRVLTSKNLDSQAGETVHVGLPGARLGWELPGL